MKKIDLKKELHKYYNPSSIEISIIDVPDSIAAECVLYHALLCMPNNRKFCGEYECQQLL